jgi:hypothetical protein
VTDSVWTVFMLLAIVAWRRPWVAALFYGLACAYKQQPWLLVPFIAIRLYLEHHGTAYRRGEGVVRFFGTALIAFLVVNLPFILWSPWNWVLGCFEPAHASMIGFGQGLAELTVTGYVLVPKVVYSLLTLASMTLLAVAYARHFSVLRDFMWIAPAIAFWFNHRSLTSYWYFNALLLGLAVFRDGALAPVGPWRSARPTLLGAGAFSLGSALVMVHFSGREQPFVIHVVEPVVTWGRSAYSLRLRLKNRLSRPVEPRFTLQASGVQPLQWHIDSGPRMLPPLEEADYTLSSIQVVAEFELTKGARLVVSDKGSTSVRTSASIVGDHTALYPAAIANGSFRFWDASSHAPSGWQVVRGGSGCSVVKVLPHSDDTVENRVQLTLNGNVPVSTWAINGQPCTHVPGTSPPELAWSAVDKRPFVAIGTDLVLPEGALYFAVHPPAEANMAPETGALYGVRLLAAGRVLLVLFGGVEKRGVLLDGTPYLVMPAPSETWSVQPLHIRPLFAEFKVALHETRTRLPRLAQLDFPMVVVHVQLFAAAPDAGTSLSAVFGPVTNAALQQDPWAGIRRDLDAPWQVDSWHGQFNFASGNFDKARIHLRRAAYDHPTAEALLAYGDAALLDGKLEEAIQAYRRAMQGGDSARGNDGLRWGPYDASDDVSAHVAFVRAIERLDKADWEAKSSYLYDAWLGLGKVALRRGDRPTLERAIAAIVKLGQIPPDELTHPAKAQ